MVNASWMYVFPRSNVEFLPPDLSDHSPGVIQSGFSQKNKKYPFKLFNYVADREDFLHMVSNIWKTQVRGSFQYQVCCKLKMVKIGLKKMVPKGTDVFDAVSKAKKLLDDCHRQLDSNPFDSNMQKLEHNLLKDYTSALVIEEGSLRRKLRLLWLKDGDRNSSFFFKITLVQNPIDDIQAADLSKDFFTDEIKSACFSLNPNKAPGPDGLDGYIFQKAWSVSGQDMTLAIKEFAPNCDSPA
ncbi:uncharacterized protein LOC126792301 [Argentina anserina]|uniref:uncharacterized protein LOC126792301 n=1 Tax=Argentina anserina TaxID=57926 RepID=UPI00217692ED|nr:uncharacterized protein LOC126792301 [Potentilla anserina]